MKSALFKLVRSKKLNPSLRRFAGTGPAKTVSGKKKLMKKYEEVIKKRKAEFAKRIMQSPRFRQQMAGKGLTARNVLNSTKMSVKEKAAMLRQTKAYRTAKKKVEKAKTGLQAQIADRRATNNLARTVQTHKKIDADNVKTVKDLRKRGLKPTERQKSEFAKDHEDLRKFQQQLDGRTSKTEKFARKLIKNPKKTLGGVTIGGLAIADVMGAADGVFPDLGVQLLEKMKK